MGTQFLQIFWFFLKRSWIWILLWDSSTFYMLATKKEKMLMCQISMMLRWRIVPTGSIFRLPLWLHLPLFSNPWWWRKAWFCQLLVVSHSDSQIIIWPWAHTHHWREVSWSNTYPYCVQCCLFFLFYFLFKSVIYQTDCRPTNGFFPVVWKTLSVPWMGWGVISWECEVVAFCSRYRDLPALLWQEEESHSSFTYIHRESEWY